MLPYPGTLKKNRLRPEMVSSTTYTNSSSAAVKNNNNEGHRHST